MTEPPMPANLTEARVVWLTGSMFTRLPTCWALWCYACGCYFAVIAFVFVWTFANVNALALASIKTRNNTFGWKSKKQ